MQAAALAIALLLQGGSATAALPPASSPGPAPTAQVQAKAETQPVATAAGDAADDPAIWRNARNPQASLIVATDKKAGIYVYGLDGKPRHFTPAGRVNNVDLIDLGPDGVIVVASDRNDEAQARLLLYRLDTAKAQLQPLGSVTGGAGEAYGVCLAPHAGGMDAFSILKHGAVHQIRITLGAGAPQGAIVRSLQLATQTEGCVTDPRSGMLYVGEEDVGIWAFPMAETARSGLLVAPVDGRHLFADVEGLALIQQGRRGGWLVASSQGDNGYALFRLPDFAPAGRFRITQGAFGATEETDGIALAAGSFGAKFPDGLFIAQDGHNASLAQNFKLVSWGDVRAALRRRK